jgi:hypothetical protein
MMARMRQPQRQFPIISEYEQPFGLSVETTYRLQVTQLGRQQIHDSFAISFIAHGGYESRRFVEQDITQLFKRKPLPVSLQLVTRRIDFAAEVAANLAVDTHFAASNQFVGFAPRAQTGFGDCLVQSQMVSLLVFAELLAAWAGEVLDFGGDLIASLLDMRGRSSQQVIAARLQVG